MVTSRGSPDNVGSDVARMSTVLFSPAHGYMSSGLDNYNGASQHLLADGTDGIHRFLILDWNFATSVGFES